MDLKRITGLGPFRKTVEEDPTRTIYYPEDSDKAFFIENPKTIELRTDQKLGRLLREKYESVMESRYFGKNGLEIVPSGQLTEEEIADLIRLSYNLTSSPKEV
ncbi:hypothetical protein IJN73_01080 [Candidatus Saccharibacteria bacterium]|nr:hypothetical protein [Candidatus Saccharibacteria bacterium]